MQSSSSQSTSKPPEPLVSSQTDDSFATVIAVDASTGDAGAYTFAVTVQSPDTGCDQYADWWEVLSEDGDLIYRRILAHSHVSEQPFQRTGGAVNIQPDTPVIVRAHLHPQGYGTQAMQGTVTSGFQEVSLPEDFAANLAATEPLPTSCAF